MVLQVGCHWCEASMTFYRDILHSNPKHSFRVVALLPQPVPEALSFLRRYLGQGKEELPTVRQIRFDTHGIAGTPTLILLDQKGHVQSSWVGKLSSQQENDVFRALKVRRVTADNSSPKDGNLDVASDLESEALSAEQ